MVKVKLLKEKVLDPTVDFFKENLQDIVLEQKYLEDPIEGLTPIGDTGLYITPDEPADPRDCDRYPSSIYCGENPFTKTPVGIEPEIVLNSCDIGIKLTPTFGFITLPEFNLVYRKPECRKKPPEKKLAPEFSLHPYIPGCFGSIDQRVMAIVCPIRSYSYLSDFAGEDESPIEIERTDTIEVLNYEYPYTGSPQYCYVPNGFYYHDSPWSYNTVLEKPLMYLKVKITTNIKSNDRYKEVLDARFRVYGYFYPGIQQPSYSNTAIVDLYLSEQTLVQLGTSITSLTVNRHVINPLFRDLTVSERTNFGTGLFIFIGGCDRVANQIEAISAGRQYISNNQTYPKYEEFTYETIYKYLDDTELPPPKEKCCMKCCPPPDDTLTKLLLKEVIKLSEKVKKLSDVVGVDEYPAELPSSLISKDEGFLGNLIPNAPKKIPNLTQFLAWYVERFDEIMGQWEIPIEVKDSDPTKPGDQPVGFKLPNMAEAIAEMFGLMLQTSVNSQILVNMNTRATLEIGQNKQQIFKTYMLALAIADHMGFDYKEVKHKLPMLFNINEEELDKLLKESELEVTAVEYTDSADLKAVSAELLQAAAIIRAVHFRKFDPKGDIKQGVVDLIKGLVATGDRINDQQPNDKGEDNFDQFLENAEKGFTTSPGITDPDHPYGRDYKERPKIREIGKDTSEV